MATIKVKRGSKTDVSSLQPAFGEPVVGSASSSTDVTRIKIGDGSTSWSALPDIITSDPDAVTTAATGNSEVASGVYNIVICTQTLYNAVVSAGNIDPNTVYFIPPT
jgi:hypothetical protein